MRKELFSIDTALITKRCVLRRFREGDGQDFYQLLDNNRSHLEDHLPSLAAQIRTAEEAEAFLRYRLANWLLQQEYAFGLWNNENAQLIGYVHIFDIDWDIPKAEVNYFIDRDYVKQGIMTEVMASCVRFAFLQLGLEKIYAHILADNYPSQRLVRRIGFQREGELRNEFKRIGGQLIDVVRFGLTREAYGE